MLAPSLLAGVALSAALSACSRPTAAREISPMSGKRVAGDHGMVAASHPDAAAAGAQVLRAGGNAIDGFVATAFALSVTDVSQTGLGGGGAMTYYDATTKRTEHLSFYPRSGDDPAWGTAEPVATRAQGRGAATPGQVAGLLEAHTRWGSLPLAQVMAPAIRLAREGFIVSPLLARTIASAKAKLALDALAAARFMPGGSPLRPGDRLVQPELAVTLERVRDGGREAFYTGPIAQHLATKVQSLGGLITVQDMARYPVTAMRPLCTDWRGYTVLGAPPPMGGSSVLEMLQIADASGVADAGGFTNTPAAVVKMADILRIAGADANRWRGDPLAQRVPAHGVSHPGFAQARAGLVGGALPDTAVAGDPWAFDTAGVSVACRALDPYPAVSASITAPANDDHDVRRRNDGTEEGESFTSHLAVVDAKGSAVSATTTVGVLFGSGVYTDGFFLNSSGSNFDARTRGTNRYANSTMSPTLILERGTVRLVIGAAGSQYIQPAITQVTLRLLAFGEDPFIAVAAPRIYAAASLKDVEVEPGYATTVYQALVTRGYTPVSRVADITFGGVHAIFVSKQGTRIGVADPRRDGVAAGY
jgi:gamma-glutamyltranspeptidase/glutathione hydrolase